METRCATGGVGSALLVEAADEEDGIAEDVEGVALVLATGNSFSLGEDADVEGSGDGKVSWATLFSEGDEPISVTELRLLGEHGALRTVASVTSEIITSLAERAGKRKSYGLRDGERKQTTPVARRINRLPDCVYILRKTPLMKLQREHQKSLAKVIAQKKSFIFRGLLSVSKEQNVYSKLRKICVLNSAEH